MWNVLDDVVGGRPLRVGVGQQLQQRRLVRDECAYPSRIAGNQGEPGDGAAAGTEHIYRFGSERIEDADEVVGPLFGRGMVVGVVDRAAPMAARVEGGDGVVAGERVGERREFLGAHR